MKSCIKGKLTFQTAGILFVLKVILLATVSIVVCWWGFAVYIYLRREYFHQPATDNEISKVDMAPVYPEEIDLAGAGPRS